MENNKYDDAVYALKNEAEKFLPGVLDMDISG